MTFHNETIDGLRKAGDVIRIFDGPFGDAIILGFNDAGDAKVSRPYAYASCVGTTGPTTLLGHETLTFSAREINDYRRVGDQRVAR